MMSKDGRSFIGMVQNQKTLVVAAWTVMFFVGLLLVPAGLFVSPSFYPGSIHNRDALGQVLYYLGFSLLTLAFNGITGMKKVIGALSTICGIVMALVSLTLPPDTFRIIMLAASGITCGGIPVLVSHLFNPSRPRRPAEEKQKLQSPARLSKCFKGLACVAILLLATNCIPGIHSFAKATSAMDPLHLRCRIDPNATVAPTVPELKQVQNDAAATARDAVAKADGVGFPDVALEEATNSTRGEQAVEAENASSNAMNSTNTITVGEVTIEVVSNSSMKMYDSCGTVMILEFNASQVLLNGTAIDLSSLQPQLSKSNVGAPVGAASSGTFWWDGVQFVFGGDVKYCHPDRDYYDISPYRSWDKEGCSLLHYQFDQETSEFTLQYGLPGAAVIIGTAIGTISAGPAGTIVGAIVGLVLGGIIWFQSYDMLDEKDCVWWLTSVRFINWLANNAAALVALYAIYPAAAISIVAGAFASCGYLLVGKTLFYDGIEAGQPTPPNHDIIPGQGIPQSRLSYGCGGSRTCMAR